MQSLTYSNIQYFMYICQMCTSMNSTSPPTTSIYTNCITTASIRSLNCDLLRAPHLAVLQLSVFLRIDLLVLVSTCRIILSSSLTAATILGHWKAYSNIQFEYNSNIFEMKFSIFQQMNGVFLCIFIRENSYSILSVGFCFAFNFEVIHFIYWDFF